MKSLLAFLVFVGVALCNSTNYYGWTPNRELVYRYESQVLTGIPEIRDSQFSGLRLSAEVRVQSFSDYSLRVKFEKSRFLTVNGEVSLSQRGRLTKSSETEQAIQASEIPSHLKAHLEKPFLVHLKRGIVENFYVEASEPQSITNIKRSFLAQIQLDVTGSRRDEIDSNSIQQQQQQQQQNRYQEESPEVSKEMTYFTTREESLLGDCQTSYSIHELPKYRALELEQEWKEQEKNLYQQVEVKSKGDEVCHGKKYYRIFKTKNLDNCRQSPVYQKIVGLRGRCDGSKAACTDLYTHLVSTTCVVCGELNEFTIRKCLKKDVVISNPMGWNTEENMKRSATVAVELLREESSFSPIPTPSDLKEKKSLIFEFPESNRNLPQNQLNKQPDQSGIVPVLAQPDLHSSPKMLFNIGISNDEISRQVVDELKRIATEVFESPESCSSTGDAAGHLTAISKYLLPLSLDELKAVKEEVMQAGRHSEASQKVLKGLFYDVLSVVGTNPSVMLIKKDVESGELTGRSAINVLEAAFRAIRTPTKELLKELVQLVKNLKNLEWQEHKSIGTTLKDLETVGMIQMSKLLYRACINPFRRMTEFPVRIYGHFCSNESSIITEEWIPYLESELESSSARHQKDDHYRMVAITSLGKLGHIKGLKSLIKVIEGSVSSRPMVRSIAVYSLKRIAKQNPVLIKPVLLSIIDNPAENTQVRIAAVSVLPWAQPSTAQLQKIAARTWFEPSKQVASFIHSTLKNLISTEVPELKAVGLRAESVIHMVKPFQYGAQYSHNINLGEFVEYLKTAVSQKFSWVYNEDEVVPARMQMTTKVYNPSFVFQGLSFSIYTQGMDYLLDRAMYTTSRKSPISESVKEQLEKITEELKIQKRDERPGEIFIQSRIAGYERLFTINKEYVMEAFERISNQLRQNPQILSEGHHFEYSRSLQVIDIQRVIPTSAGFLGYREKVMPIVYSVKGSYKGEKPMEGAIPIPTKVNAKLMPIINAKIHSHVGIICPFTEQLIGTGIDAAIHIASPLEAEVEVDSKHQVAVSIKTPESIKKSIELAHVYITPYTAKKNLKAVKPFGKASDQKTILSRSPLKKVDLDMSKKLGVSIKLWAETDAKYADFYSYWQKIQKNRLPAFLTSLVVLPSSVRRSSLKIVYNPAESETKEISLHFDLAKGKMNKQNQEEEMSLSDEKLIKKICKKNFDGHEVERCEQTLNELEAISREAEELCQRIGHDDEAERVKCQKTVQICERARKICETRHEVRSHHCQKVKDKCQSEAHNIHSVKKMLKKMGSNSQVERLNIRASVKGRFGKNSIQTAISYGYSTEEQGRVVNGFAVAEIEVPHKSFEYRASFDGKVVRPQLKNRWNTKQLLEDEIKMEVEGKIKYGRKESEKEIAIRSTLEKSEEQKQSIKKSPEFQRCSEHEEQNKVLSTTCMKVRHQAASMDKVSLTVELPKELKESTVVAKVEQLVKAYFLGQISIDQDSSITSPKEFKVVLDLSRAGDEAQLKVERAGHKWVVKNIRLPEYFKGVIPLSVRNPIQYRLIQKLTRNQEPASCRIEPDYVATFDNKTYHYEMNNCMHLIFKDCSGRIPVAVLARRESDPKSAKTIEILSGLSKIVLRPKSSSSAEGMKIELKVQEDKKEIELTHGEVHQVMCPESGRIMVEMKRYSDNVYNILFHKEKLQVITDGLRTEIIAPQLVHGRGCGLCGDLDGENTADLKTPRECLMKKDKHFAYSYMLNKEGSSSEGQQCSGIPSEDREEFNRETQQCIKREEIPTRLMNIYRRLYSLANPTVSVHLVKRQLNQICISRQRVKVCPVQSQLQNQDQTKNYLQGSQPAEVKQRNIQFTCLDLPSQKAFNLERRAKRGDNLQSELHRLPVHFAATEYEPVLCQQQQQQQQQQRQQENGSDYHDI